MIINTKASIWYEICLDICPNLGQYLSQEVNGFLDSRETVLGFDANFRQ